MARRIPEPQIMDYNAQPGGHPSSKDDKFQAKHRNWVFKMKSDDDLLIYRGLLMKALTQRFYSDLKGDQNAIRLIHLRKHRTQEAMESEFGSIVQWIRPLRRSCQPLRAFKRDYPNYPAN